MGEWERRERGKRKPDSDIADSNSTHTVTHINIITTQHRRTVTRNQSFSSHKQHVGVERPRRLRPLPPGELHQDRDHAAAASDSAELEERRHLEEVPLSRGRLLPHRDRCRPHPGMYRLVQKKPCFVKHQPGANRQNFLAT